MEDNRGQTLEDNELPLYILSLNIWGLPSWLTIEKHRRVRGIAEMIASNHYDIVCLQEVWCIEDFKLIKKICSRVLPYTNYFYSGFCGSGLCILSKWPIIKTYFSQWSLNGYIHMVHHGDWYGGKGVAFAQICYKGHNINIYNTHLIAKYSNDDTYQTHRLIQAFDTGMLINLTSSDVTLSIICGDFNSTPENICTRLMVNIGKVKDSYDAENKNGKDNYGTNDVYTNSFSRISSTAVNDKGKRIDYIMYKPGKNVTVELTSYDLPVSKIPGTDISYSDHEPVEVHMTFKKSHLQKTIQEETAFDSELLQDAIEECKSGIQLIKKNWHIYLTIAFCVVVLLNYLLTLIPSYAFALCLILFPIINYLLVMITVLYRIELNGIIGAIKRLKNLEKNCHPF